jgi:hypothetical protein
MNERANCSMPSASHFSMGCDEAERGDFFSVIGRVVRAGKRQVFARADL